MKIIYGKPEASCQSAECAYWPSYDYIKCKIDDAGIPKVSFRFNTICHSSKDGFNDAKQILYSEYSLCISKIRPGAKSAEKCKWFEQLTEWNMCN